MGVSLVDTNLVNRWQENEKSKTGKVSRGMVFHYAQPEFLVEPFIRYVSAM